VLGPSGDRVGRAPDAADDPLQAGRPPAGVRLKVLDLGTGGVTILSPDTASVWNMAWSPDGRRLAALASPPGRFGEWRRGYLAFVDADGGRWRRVPGRADPTEGVAFSPEGTAYYAPPAERYAYGATAAGVDGRTLRRLEDPALGERAASPGPGWASPSTSVRGVLTRVNPITGARTRLWEVVRRPAARDGGVAYTTDADAVTEPTSGRAHGG
jgi:sugar lactone lactonase YvrE